MENQYGEKTGAPPPPGSYPPPGTGPNYGQPPPAYPAGGAYPPAGQQYAPPAGQQYVAPAGGAYPPAGQPYPAAGGAYPQPGTTVYTTQGAVGGPTIVYAHDEVAMIQDYMIPNILACICCCWCIGIAAIIQSNECQKAKQQRDAPSARQYSECAKKLLIATIVTGVVLGVIGGVVRVVLSLTLSSEPTYTYNG